MTGSFETYVRLFKGLDRKALAELVVTLAADREIPAKAEVGQAAVLVSFGHAMGWTKELGTGAGGSNETGAGVGESLEEEIPLTHREAWEEMQRLGTEAYQAQDRVAFVREMCALRSKSTPLVTIEQVLAWLDGPRCAQVTVDPGEGS